MTTNEAGIGKIFSALLEARDEFPAEASDEVKSVSGFNPLLLGSMLGEGQKALGTGEWAWFGNDPMRILELYMAGREAAKTVGGIDSTASNDCEAVNRWLKERDLTIKLQDKGPHQVYMASKQMIGAQWLTEGIPSIRLNNALNRMVDTFGHRLAGESGVQAFSFDGSRGGDIAIRLPMQDQRTMWLSPLAVQPHPIMVAPLAFEIINRAKKTAAIKVEPDSETEALVPMVKLDLKSDFTNLLRGLRFGSKEISECLGQMIFSMNHKGAKVVEAMAAGTFESMVRHYEITGPFIMTIEDPKLPGLPRTSAWVHTSAFENPGEITF